MSQNVNNELFCNVGPSLERMSKMTAMVQGKPSDSETMVCRGKGYKCGIDVTLAVVGGKWKASILWHLARATMRFSEF